MNSKVKSALGSLKRALLVSIVLMVLCGLIYPLVLTGLSQLIFPHQANGIMITAADGTVLGSEIVGQDFTDDRFMKCRPSQYHYNTYTSDGKYNNGEDYAGLSSGSANYGPTNPDLQARVEADIQTFLEAHPGVSREDIPTDLLTASGSGLDPHISPASAQIQIPQLAVNTGLSQERLQEIVAQHTTGKFLGIFGEETVNVLGVNLDIAQELGMIELAK